MPHPYYEHHERKEDLVPPCRHTRRAARIIEWDECKACGGEFDARVMDRGLCPTCLENVEHYESVCK